MTSMTFVSISILLSIVLSLISFNHIYCIDLSINSLSSTISSFGLTDSLLSNAVLTKETLEKDTYDYIIVGGGTAGCVLANRLTADKNKKVLVLEAGSSDYNNKYIKIPAGILKVFKDPKFDWDYESAVEENNRAMYLCRGRVLGGSSCTNVLLYNRGDRNDYVKWYKETGSKEWSPDNLVEYFKKSEHYYKDSKFHGSKGEYYVTKVPYQNELSKTFLNACVSLGIKENDDFNDWSKSQVGSGKFDVSQKNGARCSAASQFLSPVIHRRNLKVVTSALVSSLDIQNKEVVGVKYTINDKPYYAKVSSKGEVLLTSGSIGSPQILLLSGVGPASQLNKLGISVKHNLEEVGKNLQDHPATVVSYQCSPGNDGVSTSSKLRIPGTTIPNPLSFIQWALTGSGPLTSSACDHGAYVKTDPNLESPDLQLRFIAARAIAADGMNTLTEFKNTKTLPDGFSVQCLVARPQSKGSVELRSKNPKDKPIIKSGYFTYNNDIKVMREGIKLARKLVSSKAFDKYRGFEVYPGPDITTDEQIDNYIKSTVHTANALVGTCRMGSDEGAVVDPYLRVNGIKKLRIVDSSVMPSIPGGQTAAATIMIAEKAVDFLLINQ